MSIWLVFVFFFSYELTFNVSLKRFWNHGFCTLNIVIGAFTFIKTCKLCDYYSRCRMVYRSNYIHLPKSNPIRFRISISSWISNLSSNEKKYSDLQMNSIRIKLLNTLTHWDVQMKLKNATHLSSDMLQLICVFLCVLTVMKGNWIAEFCDGTSPRSSDSLFRATRVLNETCCKISSRNCCCLLSIRSRRISISASKALHCWFNSNLATHKQTKWTRNVNE